jgi:hypothetical protein
MGAGTDWETPQFAQKPCQVAHVTDGMLNFVVAIFFAISVMTVKMTLFEQLHMYLRQSSDTSQQHCDGFLGV